MFVTFCVTDGFIYFVAFFVHYAVVFIFSLRVSRLCLLKTV